MVRSPISARNMVYGRCRVSGTIVYLSTTGSKNEWLHIVVTLAGHEIEEIEEVYFNDELVPLVSNTPTGFYNGVARVNKHLGVSGQTADTDLINDTASLTDGKWTSDHKLSGIAYLYVRLTWDTEKFPSGIPNISAVIKGKKVEDTRNTITVPPTLVYSANPALCLRDYLLDSALGMGMSASEVDTTATNAAATICDEQVRILPLDPIAYENRYECNGVIATSASPDENIGKLLSAMGGLIAYSGGKVVPYAGGYRIPTVTFTEKHFVGPLNIQTRTSARDRVNSVKGVYVSEGNGWQVSDFPTISSATYVSNDNNTRYYRDVVLPFTTSSSCAQRLAVIELRRAREEITFTARFRLEAMQVRAGDTVMITNAKLGWSSKVFEVMEWHFATDGNPPQIYIDMTLRETASSVYSWSVSDDQIYVPDAPNTTLPNPFTLSAPSGLTLTADGTTQFIQTDGTAVPRIKVKWTSPAEEFIQSGGAVVIEYKPSTSTTYLTWSRVEGAQTEDYISSDVQIGTNYNVRIFGESYFKISTSYVTSAITVSPDTTPPATPTGLTAIAGTGQIISLDWDDNTEPDFGEYGVWRNTSNDSGGATKIAETRASRFVDVNLTLGTIYYYWISAYDRSENQSAKSTGASATAVAVTAGQTDSTPPADPSAPTFNTSGTYLSGDGTTLARIVVDMPAFTTRCVIMNLLYRRNGTTGWIVADQRSTEYGTSSIDDLTPNVTYQIAVQAFSAFGIGSGIVINGTPQTAPNNATAPATPSGSSLSKVGVTPKLIESTREYYFGTRASWTPNTETDFDHYEIKAVSTNNSSDTSYTWFGEAGGSNSLVSTKANTMCLYAATPSTGFTFLRAVNRSGVASAWVYVGLAADNAFLGAGTISAQNKNDVSVEGIKTGAISASSVRQVAAVFQESAVVLLSGGSPTETFSVDISNRGFSTKPDVGVAGCASDGNLIAAYDFDHASNSSSTAYVRAATLDGSNIGAGYYRFSIDFTEYN
jgi:hypothetical protein